MASNIVKYDAKTGKKLAKGATTTDSLGNTFKQGDTYAPKITASGGSSLPPRNDNQANGGAGYNALSRMSAQGLSNPDSSFQGTSYSDSSNIPSIAKTNVVNNANLQATNPLLFPNQNPTEIPTVYPTTLAQQEDIAKAQQADTFQSYLDKLEAPPSSADAYRKAQKETGILNKQQAVNELSGKLNSIVAQGQAQQLSLVGQGRGIPEAIIGGQQAQIGRETAIAALPVQAQLSAAQGDLESAEQNLNTLFKIYSDDATNKYNYKKSVNEAIYNFASAQDKAQLDKIQKLQDREYDKTQADIKAKNDIALEATKNGASAATISAISQAPDFASALKAAGSSLLNTQIIKLDNGQTVMIDGQGKVIKNLGGAKADSSVGTNYVITKDTLKNTYGNDVVSLIANTIKTSGAKQSQSTNDAINVISGLQQLVRDNPDAKFAGLQPIRLTPQRWKSSEARTNLSNIEAVNLKVQQWASGAALTEAQTKSVEKMTPRKGDTDRQVVDKTNALANYMISQVSGQLAGQGVGFAMDKVDMFTKTPEQELSELYQNPATKQKIIEAVQMFPNYTDDEILQIVTP